MWSWVKRLFAKPAPPTAGPVSPPSSSAAPAPGAARHSSSGQVEAFIPDAHAPAFTELPEWASPLTSVESLNEFLELVYRYFRLRKIEIRLDDGVIISQEPTADPTSTYDRYRYGLWNLMQTLAATEREDWAGIIAAHFDSVRRAPDVEAQFADRLASFEQGREHLVVRVFEQGYLPPEAKQHQLQRNSIPGLVSAVVVDFPESCRTLRREEAEAWKVPESEIWEAAIANTPRMARAEARTLGDEGPSPIQLLTGDSIYVASMLHNLADSPDMLGVYGCFVSAPVRHLLLTVPFNGAEAMRSLAPLIGMTVQIEEQGPGAVSKRVWWYARGVYEELKYAIDGRRIEITDMPPSLRELLDSLKDDTPETDQP